MFIVFPSVKFKQGGRTVGGRAGTLYFSNRKCLDANITYYFVLFSLAWTAWSSFGRAYSNAMSSLRNVRGAVSIRDEQRSLFGKRSSSITQTPTRKLKKTITWTNKFVCLSGNNVSKAPTTNTSKMLLLSAGLGEKKIVIKDIDCTPNQFQEELTKHFPKLRDGGGFEFLRCIPNSRNLEVVPSLSPRLLKREIGNGRVYIRPVQKPLSLEASGVELSSDEEATKVLHVNVQFLWVLAGVH